jgi:hypothetical protein
LIRLLADRNLPLASVLRLRAEGFDVAVAESGVSDEDLLARATADRRVVLTFDRDFGRLVVGAGMLGSAGVVYFRLRGARPETPAEMLLPLLRDPRVVLQGSFTTVRAGRIRQRFPLRR